METKICVFEENNISFLMDKNNKMMVNATEMAKVFGKQVSEFMSNDSTKAFVKEALKNGNSRFINISKESDLFYSAQKSGTWMHRILALKFAAWLNPTFELWVYSTIEKLLFGKHVEREKSFERTLQFKNEMDKLKEKQHKTGENFERYLDIEKQINREKLVRSSLTKESITDMLTLFNED